MKLMSKVAMMSVFALCVMDVGAAPISSISFEGFGTTNIVTTGTKDDGTTGGQDNETYWYITNGVDNESHVVTSNTSYDAKCSYPKFFRDGTHAKYLKVSTAQPLYRTVNPIATIGSPTEWATTNVAANGTYVDTLVQFSPSDSEPTPGDNDKIIIWMNDATNLVVTAGYVDDALSVYPTNYPMAVAVSPSTWYRLTVKTVKDITGGLQYCGFQVYLDGDPLASSATWHTMSDGTITALADYLNQEQLGLINGNKVVVSLKGSTEAATPQLSAVGFQGEGAIDDYVVSEDTPDFNGGVTSLDFILAWDTSAGVSSAQYVIGSSVTTNDAVNGQTIAISAADTVVTVLPKYADWYTAGTWTVDDTSKATVSGNAFTVLATGGTGTIVATAATNTTGKTGSDFNLTGDLANVDASKLMAWATGNGGQTDIATINGNSESINYYLLNAALATGAPKLTITDIKESGENWLITVKAMTPADATISMGTEGEGGSKTINGYLRMATTATLGSTWTTTTYPMTFDANGLATVTVPGADGKFMKAGVVATESTNVQ